MIKDATTYEIMNPEDYGVSSVLTFGARSGSAALRGRYNAMGLEVDDFSLCAERFFTIADTRKEIDDADVVMSVYGGEIDEKYHLENFHPIVNGEFRAAVEIGLSSSKFCSQISGGNGQIDAAFNAIKQATDVNYDLIDFRVRSDGRGSDSEGISRIEMSNGQYFVIGISQGTDVVTSAIEAYIDGCNRLAYIEEVM